jgi:hypothetical protein
MSTLAKSAAVFAAERVSPQTVEILQTLENHEKQLMRELRGVKTGRKRLAALLVRANRAKMAADHLAYVIDRNLRMG